jgi:hypothetical protein
MELVSNVAPTPLSLMFARICACRQIGNGLLDLTPCLVGCDLTLTDTAREMDALMDRDATIFRPGTLSIVVSHCCENLDWLFLSESYTAVDAVYIYVKCDQGYGPHAFMHNASLCTPPTHDEVVRMREQAMGLGHSVSNVNLPELHLIRSFEYGRWKCFSTDECGNFPSVYLIGSPCSLRAPGAYLGHIIHNYNNLTDGILFLQGRIANHLPSSHLTNLVQPYVEYARAHKVSLHQLLHTPWDCAVPPCGRATR